MKPYLYQINRAVNLVMILALSFGSVTPNVLAETVGASDIKAAEKYAEELPVKVEKTAKAVLTSCSVDSKSRYKSAISSLNSKFQQSANPSQLTCSGKTTAESDLKATRDLLTELRKVREKEIFEVEALNQLTYDPDHFLINDLQIETNLKKMLCERSQIALTQLSKDAALKKFNQCEDQTSEIAQTIALAAKSAIKKFKTQNLRKPTEADLASVNSNLKQLKSACESIGAGMIVASAGTKIDVPKVDTRSLSSDELQLKEMQKKVFTLNPKPAATPDQRKIQESNYMTTVYPVLVKIFASPYGRLLSNSNYLQNKIGLNMDADWNQPQFCYGIKNGVSISKGEMNTGYFGSPANKITGSRAVVRQNMSDLMMTRIPGLKEKFWDHLAESAFLQSPLAQAQQQVAYELLYNAHNDDVKRFIQANPVYAELACRAIQHESFWEKGNTKKIYAWGKNIISYGGMGVGIVGGFFTGGSGWIIAATIATGLTSSTISTGLIYKNELDLSKKKNIEEIQTANQAVIAQIATQTEEDQKKIKSYADQFEELAAARNFGFGSVISSSKDPKVLRSELLKGARDAKEQALVELGFNYFTTAASLGIGSGLGKFAAFAKVNKLAAAEKLAISFAKLEGQIVSPTDVLSSIGMCLVLKDCTGAGVAIGAMSKYAHLKMGPIFSSLRKIPGNGAKSYEELIEYAAEGLAKQSKLSKADIKAQLRLSLSEKSFNESIRVPPVALHPVEPDGFFEKLIFKYSNKTPQVDEKLFEPYNLKVSKLEDYKVCDQGHGSTCVLSAGNSLMKLNKLLPEGMEIDPQYLDGLRIWQRSSNLLDEVSKSKVPMSGIAETVQKDILNAGNHSIDFFNTTSQFVPKLRPIPKVQDVPEMLTVKSREKLYRELTEVFAQAHSKPRVELQKQLDAVMTKYYGPLQTSLEAGAQLKGLSLESYSLAYDEIKVNAQKKYSKDMLNGKNVARFPTNVHSATEEVMADVIRKNLAEGKSLLISLKASDESFESLRTGKLSGLDGTSDGGHKLVIVGAKTGKNGEIEELLLLNSWGAQSGKSGYVSANWKELVAHKKFVVDELKPIKQEVSAEAASTKKLLPAAPEQKLITRFSSEGKELFAKQLASKKITEAGQYISVDRKDYVLHGKIIGFEQVGSETRVKVLGVSGVAETLPVNDYANSYVTQESKSKFEAKRQSFLSQIAEKKTPYITYFTPETGEMITAKVIGYQKVDGQDAPIVMLTNGKVRTLDKARMESALLNNSNLSFDASKRANMITLEDGTKVYAKKNIQDLAKAKTKLVEEELDAQKYKQVYEAGKSKQVTLNGHDDAFVLSEAPANSKKTKVSKMATALEEKHGVVMLQSKKANLEENSNGFFSKGAKLQEKLLTQTRTVINSHQRTLQGEISATDIHEIGHAKTNINKNNNKFDPMANSYHAVIKNGEKVVLPAADEGGYKYYSQADESRQHAFNFITNMRQRPEYEIRQDFKNNGKLEVKEVFGVSTVNYLEAVETASTRLKTLKGLNERGTVMSELAKKQLNGVNPEQVISFSREGKVHYAKILTEKGLVKIPIQSKIARKALQYNPNDKSFTLFKPNKSELIEYLNFNLNESNTMYRNQSEAIANSKQHLDFIKANPNAKITYEEYLFFRKDFMKVKTSVKFQEPAPERKPTNLFEGDDDF